MEAPRSRYERVSGADLTNLLAERPGLPWHVALVGVLDGRPLTGSDGALLEDPVRRALEQALPREPRLHQVLHRTRPGQGRPFWRDAGTVDLDRHLRVAPVGPPGDRAALLRTAEALLATGMDLTRPLWDLTLVPGLAGGHVGLVLRLHHVVADGSTAVRVLGALLDGTGPGPDPAPGAEVGPVDGPAGAGPSGLELAADAWRCRLGAARARLAGTAGTLHALRALRARPASTAGSPGTASSLRAMAGQVRALVRPSEPSPRTSLTRPLGPRRRLAALDVPLGPLRDLAHDQRAGLNDVVLAAVAGGLREVLRARGEADAVTLRASVPVSLRGGPGADPGSRGNRVGVMLVPLPLGERDPLRRLTSVALSTAAEKDRARAAGHLAVTSTTLGIRLAMPLLRHQRLVSLFVSNVRGPDRPLALAGAPLRTAWPVPPIAGNVTLGVAVLSYAGRLGITLVTDADAWPDLDVLEHALAAELATYAWLAPPAGPARAEEGV